MKRKQKIRRIEGSEEHTPGVKEIKVTNVGKVSGSYGLTSRLGPLELEKVRLER